MRPKAAQQQGIQALLTTFQGEWDSLMLEVFTLKQQLNASQQELAQSLYQQDAACRVIARLMKENAELKREISVRPSNDGSHNGMDIDASADGGAPVLTTEMNKRVEEKTQQLIEMRSNRKIPASTASRDRVAGYTETSHLAPHKTGATLAIAAYGGLVVSAGFDKTVSVLDGATATKIASLTGPTKSVVSVKIGAFGSGTRVVAVEESGILHVWDAPTRGDSFTLTKKIAVENLSSPVKGLDLHPVGDLVILLSETSFTFVDLSSEHTSTQSPSALKSGASSIAIHPDGQIMAIGTTSGAIPVFSVQNASVLATFEGHTDAVTGLSFSENGYNLTSVGLDGMARVWDLESSACSSTITLSSQPSAVSYDFSGRFLAITVTPSSGPRELRVFMSKTGDLVASFPLSAKTDNKASPPSSIAFGPDASFIAISQDRNVRFWSAQ